MSFRAAAISLIVCALWSARLSAQSDTYYSENFQSGAVASSPAGWTEIWPGQPLASPGFQIWPDPTLQNQSVNLVYGIRTLPTNREPAGAGSGVASVYRDRDFSSSRRLVYRGRFLRRSSEIRPGLVIHSGPSPTERSYLAALWNESAGSVPTMRVSASDGVPLTGRSDSGFVVETNRWIQFHLEVTDESGATRIQAKFWKSGESESQSFSIDARDTSAGRRSSGKIGVWATRMPTRARAVEHPCDDCRREETGLALFDDLFVRSESEIAETDRTAPLIRVFESGREMQDGTRFDRAVQPEILVSDDSGLPSFSALLDGLPFVPGTIIRSGGAHRLEVRATDSSGNTASLTLNFEIRIVAPNDTVPPVIEFLEGSAPLTDGALFGRDVLPVIRVVDESSVTLTAEIDGAPFVAGGPVTLDGGHQLTATAIDAAGNRTQRSVRFSIDKRAPNVQITSPVSGSCIDATAVTLRGTVSDPNFRELVVRLVYQTIQQTIQQIIPASMDAGGRSWSVTIPTTAEGPHQLMVDAVDTLDHHALVPFSLIIDRTAPVIVVRESAAIFAATMINRPVSLLPSASDAGGVVGVTATLDGASYESGTRIDAEGRHSLRVAATDCAGHRAEQVLEFTIDRTPPVIRSIVPAESAIVGSAPTSLTGVTDPDVARVSVHGTQLSAVPGSGGAFTIAGLTFQEGQNEFLLIAEDLAGNRSERTYAFTLRSGRSVITILENGSALASGSLFNRPVTPEIKVDDPAATVVSRLNGAAFVSGTRVENEGTYTLIVTATNEGGHESRLETAFTVDRTPPVVKILSPSAASTDKSTVDVSGTVGDSTSASLNGRPLTIAAGGSFTVSALPIDRGENALTLIGRDRAGNQSQDLVVVIRDDLGPAVILTHPLDQSATNRRSTSVMGRVTSDPFDGTVTVGTTAAVVDTDGTFRIDAYPLVEGENTISVSVRSSVGRSSSASVRVIGDFTPPRISVLESGAPLRDGAQFSDRALLSLDASDTRSSVSTEMLIDGVRQAVTASGSNGLVASSTPTPVTGGGGHVVVATARDSAGNESRTERTFFIGAGGSGGVCELSAFDPAGGAVVSASAVTILGRVAGGPGVSVNGLPALMADGSFSARVELPTEGPNTIQLTCTDLAGAVRGTPVTLTLLRVTGQPTITIQSPAEMFVSDSGQISVRGSVGPGVSSVEVNGVQATLNGESFTATGVRLSGGLNVLVARARTSGSRTAAVSRRVLFLDKLPSLAITSPVANFVSGENRIDVSGTFRNVDPSTITVSPASSAAVQSIVHSDTSGAFVFAGVPLVAGEQRLIVRGRDRSNREATAEVQISLQSGTPSISITQPADNSFFGISAGTTIAVNGRFRAAEGARVEVNGTVASLDPATSSFSSSVPFSTSAGFTPIVARLTEPGGASAIDLVRVTRLASAPSVIQTFPDDGAVEVEGGALILVLFSSPMDRASLTGGGVRLKSANGSPVSGVYWLDDSVLSFAPSSLLNPGERYTIRVTTAARDLAANAIGAEVTRSFIVASSAPQTAPVLDPIATTICAPQILIAGTSQPGSRVRVESGSLSQLGSADQAGRFAVTLPLSGEPGFRLIRVRTVGSDGSLSSAAELRFRLDCSGPRVLDASYDPGSNRVTIRFSEPVLPASITPESIFLRTESGQPISGALSVADSAVLITPTESLVSRAFHVLATTAVRDLQSNALSSPFTKLFSPDGVEPGGGEGFGFLAGEIFDATTGRPLPGVSIRVEVPSAALAGTRLVQKIETNATSQVTSLNSTTDSRGRYVIRVPEGAHSIQASAPGFTSVWRQIVVPAGSGLVPVDIRLTKMAAPVISNGSTALLAVHGGDTEVTRRVEFLASSPTASGQAVTLTAVGGQGLAGLLPLGWSYLASAEVSGSLPGGTLGGTLSFLVPVTDIETAGQSLAAVRYDSERDEWKTIQSVVNLSGGKAVVPISTTGAYALVYADRTGTRPPAPANGLALQGVPIDPSAVPLLRATAFRVNPSTVLPTGRAVATLELDATGAATFPSGTAVQAYIDEELRLADGSRLLDHPFAADLIVFRNLAGNRAVADFHLAPSARAAEVILEVGYERIRIVPYPGRIERGSLVGPEGGRVPGDDTVSIEIPTGAAPEPLRASALSMAPPEIAAVGPVTGFKVMGGFRFSLSRLNPPAPRDGNLDGQVDVVPAPALFNSARASYVIEASKLPAATSQLILAEIMGQTPFGILVRMVSQFTAGPVTGAAIRFNTRAIDRSVLPLDGLIRDGRYLVLASEAPIAFAFGTLRGSGGATLSDGRIGTPSLGVTDLSRSSGLFILPVPATPATPFTVLARHQSTGEATIHTAASSPAPDSVVRLGDVILAAQPPSIVSTSPANLSRDVSLTTSIRVTFGSALDLSSVTPDAVTVRENSTGRFVSGAIAPEGSLVITWTLPSGARLQPNDTYVVTVAATVRGANGAPLSRAHTFGFSTVTVVTNAEVRAERIHITLPDSEGRSRIYGDGGALPAGWQGVAARRFRDFVQRYQATASTDGSFSFEVGAGDPADRITTSDSIDLLVLNSSGNTAAIISLTPFVTFDGRGFLAAPGVETTFTSVDNIRITVPPGTFDTPTVVTAGLSSRERLDGVPSFDQELRYSSGITLTFDGTARKRIDVSVPVPPGGDSANRQFLLALLGQSMRGPRLMIVNALRLDNGRLTTASTVAGTATLPAQSSSRTVRGNAVTFEEINEILLGVTHPGSYHVVEMRAPAWNFGVIESIQGSVDLFVDLMNSLFVSGVYIAEGKGRIAFPVPTGIPFTVSGVDTATGLQAFTRVYDPLPSGVPGTPATIPSPLENAAGPYPLYASPGRVEIVDLQLAGFPINSVRNVNLTLSTGGILTITNSLLARTRLEALNVTSGLTADNAGDNSKPLRMNASIGDRIVLLIGERDIDPAAGLTVVFNEPIAVGTARNVREIDAFLRGLFRLEQASAALEGPHDFRADLTSQVQFRIDSGNRRVMILLPSELQRGARYRLTMKKNIADTSGPVGSGGLTLGQSTRRTSAGLVPTGGGSDLHFEFDIRQAGGAVSEFCLRESADSSKGVVRDLAVDGNLLFVAALDGGVLVYDTADPAALDGDRSCATSPLPKAAIPPGITQNWSVTTDHHGRVFTTGVTSTFGVLRTYRLEDFVGTSSPSPKIVQNPRGAATVSFAIGASSNMNLATSTAMSDRKEGLPRKIKILVQDAENVYENREAFKRAFSVAPQTAYPGGIFEKFAVSIPLDPETSYGVQRITVENLSRNLRWSADAYLDSPASINDILIGPHDRIRVRKNLTTYGVISLFGYGLAIYDINAIENNDGRTPRSPKPREQVALTSAQLRTVCRQVDAATAGDRCPIANLTFSPDLVVQPSATSQFTVYALDSTKGILDVNVVPPVFITPARMNRGDNGLVFSSPFNSPSGPSSVDHPRLTELRSLFAARAGRAPRGRFSSIDSYRWKLSRSSNLDGVRGSAPFTDLRRDYALVAGNEYGLLITEVGGRNGVEYSPIADQHLVDVIWIPAGAYGVRVVEGENLATVVDGEGRALLVDLSRIDERWDSSGSAIPPAALFSTARLSLQTNGSYGVGVDDPRILWKSEPGLFAGTLPPILDPSTGILYGGPVAGRELRAISVVDSRVRIKVNMGGEGLQDVGSIVPLGVAPPSSVQSQIEALRPCRPADGSHVVCRENASLSAFRIEATLPGAMSESLGRSSNTLRLAVESERVSGAATEQTPDGFPLAHLRLTRPDGSPEIASRRATNFVFTRDLPDDPALMEKLRHQRGFNRFVSPWIVALADPRASSSYVWPEGSNKTALGCSNCERPRHLIGKTEANGVYELYTNGRFLSVRPERCTTCEGSAYSYMRADGRLEARVSTVMADTVRPPEVLVAAHNPPVAGGMIQETVYLHSGEVETSAVDFNAGGRAGLNVVYDRTYRSRTIGGTALGQGWTSSMFQRLRELPSGDVEYRDGQGEIWLFRYERFAREYVSPEGLFLRLSRTDRGWTLIDQKWRPSTFDALGRLISESDEFYDPAVPGSGNTIHYLYDHQGRLASIVDPAGRTSTLRYWSESDSIAGAYPGLLREISDWRSTPRIVEYHYDSAGRLIAAQLPVVTNADNSRPTTRYSYADAGTFTGKLELGSNLLSITDPTESARSGARRVELTYETSGANRDRLTAQKWATGETVSIEYVSRTEVNVTDALGQKRNHILQIPAAPSASGRGYFEDRAHVTEIKELDVPVWAAATTGELPNTIASGDPAVTTQTRTRSFIYEPGRGGLLSSSSIHGIRKTSLTYKNPGSGAAGVVPQSVTTEPVAITPKSKSKVSLPASLAITRTFDYQDGPNGGSFLKSVSSGGKAVESAQPHRYKRDPGSQNDQIAVAQKFGLNGLLDKTGSSGGTDPGGAGSETLIQYASMTGPLHERGLPTAIHEGSALSTFIKYPDEDLEVKISPRGVITSTTFDAWRRPVKITVQGPGLTMEDRIEYDGTGRVVKQIRRQGPEDVTTSYVYDAMGRQKQVTVDRIAVAGGSVTTKTEYDLPNKTIRTTAPGGAVTITELDSLGRTRRTATDTGSSPVEQRFAYDIDDRAVFQTDMQTASAVAYDIHGRAIGARHPDGRTTTTQYDEWNHPVGTREIAADGVTLAGESRRTFTPSGRVVESRTRIETDRESISKFLWDGAGRTTGSSAEGPTSPSRAAHQRYDLAGRLMRAESGGGTASAVTQPFEVSEIKSYAGALPGVTETREKTGEPFTLEQQFNTAGDSVQQNLGSLEWKRSFDEAGNVTSASDPNRPPARMDWDSRGSLQTEQLPDGALNRFGYHASGAATKYQDPTDESTNTRTDLSGRPMERTYPDGTREAVIWDGPRMKSMTDRQGRVQNLIYNAKGQLTEIQNGSGQPLDRVEYDSAGRMTRWTNKDSATVWENFDLAGNPKQTRQIRFRGESGFASPPEVLDEYTQQHRWNEHGERVLAQMPRSVVGLGAGWTSWLRQDYDAAGNLERLTRLAEELSSSGQVLLEASYRNAGRPDLRVVTPRCSTSSCAPIVRRYGYEPETARLNRMAVEVGAMRVAGSEVRFDGLQKSDARLLGVSSEERHTLWAYDDRSRLQGSVFGTLFAGIDPVTAAVPGRAIEKMTPADFRREQERTPQLDPATSAALASRGVNLAHVDPPTMVMKEKPGGGHKIDELVRGSETRKMEYAGAERVDDGQFIYEFDEKSRLIRATEKPKTTALPIRRVLYSYNGANRLIGRRAEMAPITSLITAPAPSDWLLETRLAILGADGLPAEVTFVWDPISDNLVTVARAAATSTDAHNGILKQIIHGGLSYDDPIEVATLEVGATGDSSNINHLYPVFDEAAAGNLQVVLNRNSQVVARNLSNDPYAGEELELRGSAVDRVSLKATKNAAGNLESVQVSLRTTEPISAVTLAAGVRLAAVDANGALVRAASSTASLSDPWTATWTLSATEWSALSNPAAATVGSVSRTPSALSVAATNTLRSATWSLDIPILPAPEWAILSKPVFVSPDLPVEVRESLSTLTSSMSAIAPSSEQTTTLYEIPNLALLGAPSSSDTPIEQLLTATFHAQPFTEPMTAKNYVRARWYDQRTGTFLTPDPMGYGDSANLYAFCSGDPIGCRDPRGLAGYFFDGTNNDRAEMKGFETNVAKLYDLYAGKAYYREGVGTRFPRVAGLIAGAGGAERIEWMYERVVAAYNAGDDKIDIFGFSRGAAQAVALANVIRERGIPDLTSAEVEYEDRTGGAWKKSTTYRRKFMNVPIRYLGIFDTVGSFGLGGNDVNIGKDLRRPTNVGAIRHAVSTDEKRYFFPLTSMLDAPGKGPAYVVEKAFRGAHSDAGGGYRDDAQLAREALLWMYAEAQSAGVPLNDLPPQALQMTLEDAVAHDSRWANDKVIGSVFEELGVPYQRNIYYQGGQR